MFINNNKIKYRGLLTSLLIIFVVVGFGVFIAGDEASAARKPCPPGEITLQIAIPGLQKISRSSANYCIPNEQALPNYVKAIYNLFISIVGILAVIMIMAGGFQWLMAVGNAQKIAGAKTTILSAVMGLILALTSFLILDIINPGLINLKLKPTKLTGREFDSNMPYCDKSSGAVPDKIKFGISSGVYGSGYIWDFIDSYRCGKSYSIKDKDTQCLGYMCDSDEGHCVKKNTIGEFGCGSALLLSGLRDFGYPIKYYKNNTLFDKKILVQCGQVTHYDNKLEISVRCPNDGDICVIDRSQGLQPLGGETEIKRYEDVVDKGEVIIGKFAGSKCWPK